MIVENATDLRTKNCSFKFMSAQLNTEFFFNSQDLSYKPGDYLLFGAETFGLPKEAVSECKEGEFSGGIARIPIDETYVRSLNLSVATGIGLYEALRQIDKSVRPLDVLTRRPD